jgi:DNA-directed RNA polymerase specialized sigma24 family protein
MEMTMNTNDTKNPDLTNAPTFGATAEADAPLAGNDNATRGGVPDTTPLAAHPAAVQCIRATLRRYRVTPENMADAIADVQTESIEAARAGAMPANLAQWKSLVRTVAVHWAIDRLREAKARKKYDAGLCEDADVYLRPTLHWEHRDPVDTKRYLAVLKELFDSGQMPEDGDEILQAEADGVPHADIAAELGVTQTVVDNRLSRMRARFRARLAALGLLTLVLLLMAALMAPVADVAAPAPQVEPSAEPASEGGTPPVETNRHRPSEEIAPFPL